MMVDKGWRIGFDPGGTRGSSAARSTGSIKEVTDDDHDDVSSSKLIPNT